MTIDFGRDTSCTDDLHPGRMVSGVELVQEAVYRRLIAPRGALVSDPSYGYDVRALLGVGSTDAGMARVPIVVRGEVLKDPRIRTCTVRAQRTQVGSSSYALTLDVQCTTDVGPFVLTLRIDDVSVERLRP